MLPLLDKKESDEGTCITPSSYQWITVLVKALTRVKEQIYDYFIRSSVEGACRRDAVYYTDVLCSNGTVVTSVIDPIQIGNSTETSFVKTGTMCDEPSPQTD